MTGALVSGWHRAAAVSLALVAVALAGCGGGARAPSPSDQARRTVASFLREARARDPAACDLLSDHFLTQQGAGSVAAARAACRRNVIGLRVPRGLRVTAVEAGNATAVVRTGSPDAPGATFGLVRQGGGYRIDTVGGY